MPRPGWAPRWTAAAGRWGCRLLVLLLLLPGPSCGSEITFELPDNAKQCFYEDITQGTKCTLEFQVLLLFPVSLVGYPRVTSLAYARHLVFLLGAQRKNYL